MGSPQLKAKQELNYRRGTTSKSCRYCNHFVADFQNLGWEGIDPEGTELRCRIIGLLSGRSYRIRPYNVCDRYYGSEYLKRN
jgi:hypothetical protein